MNMGASGYVVGHEEQRGESGVAPIGEKRPDVALAKCTSRGHLSRPAVSGALWLTEG